MSLDLALSTALAGVEKLVNQALRLDPASQQKIRALDGKVICIKSQTPSLSIYLSFHQQGLMLSSIGDQVGDATIEGKASSLVNLLLAGDKQAAIRQQAIQIQGDAAAIQQLQILADSLDIDWEYQLSTFAGDIPTQLLSDGLRHLQTFLSKSHARMSSNLDEFLHEESRLLPGKGELETFYQRIDELRLRVDRTKSRLSRMENN